MHTQHAQNRPGDAGGVTLAILLGFFIGPLAVFALAGDYWHTVPIQGQTPRIIAGIVALVLLIGALTNATRFRNAGMMGTITGLSSGVGELAVAVVPWLSPHRPAIQCQSGEICPLPSAPAVPSASDLAHIAITAGIFFTLLFAVAGFSLALLVSVIRHRMA